MLVVQYDISITAIFAAAGYKRSNATVARGTTTISQVEGKTPKTMHGHGKARSRWLWQERSEEGAMGRLTRV
jgi:hypothetical protein